MPKFYGRNGGVRLSQMPFNHHLGDEPIKDILVVDDVGDKKYFSIKVFARDEGHAQKIMMGVIRTVYPGIVITGNSVSLFADDEGEGEGYHLTDFTCRARLADDGYYNVLGSGYLWMMQRRVFL